MKKVLLSLALIVTAGYSCKKDKYCWQCTTTITTTTSAGINLSSENTTKCDMNEKEINDYQKNNSTSTSSGDYSQTISTICQKQ